MDNNKYFYRRIIRYESMLALLFSSILIFLILASPPVVSGEVIKLDPEATYLRTSDDPGAHWSTPILLAELGITEGDDIILKELGEYSAYGTADTDNDTRLMAVFSASNVLLSPNQRYRVQDAIDAGIDYSSQPTYNGNYPTDFPEDFEVDPDGTILEVPQDAQYLFAAAADCYFGGNSDPDNDYALEIAIYTTTTTTSILPTTSTTTTTKPCVCPLLCIYGEGSEEVALLRQYRDNVLMQTPEGRELIKLYYLWSPVILKSMEEDEEFKEEVKQMIDGVLPMIKIEVE